MKTRIRQLKDGAVEIIRLLSPDDLAGYRKDDPLLYEKSIVWLENCDVLSYVRVKTVRTARSRRGPIYLGEGGRVVGYSKLTPNARRCPETQGYVRRVFYLTSDDPADPNSSPPSAAYDPRALLPGVAGQQLNLSSHSSEVCS